MRIVGIGASAGGMDPLIELLRNLPDDTGAALVIIFHLSPKHKSVMNEILGRHTKMPVAVVNEMTSVQPNHIYLISHNKSLIYKDGMLVPSKLRNNQPVNSPIDIFFHSLAISIKDKAIGIILSGSGTDGARGMQTIKEHGGIVIVQEPHSAKFEGMPQAFIHSHISDLILPPGEIAETLKEIFKREHDSHEGFTFSEESENDVSTSVFQEIINIISQTVDIDFSAYREATLGRRLINRMILLKCENPGEYLQLIRQDKEEASIIGKDFLIGVTRFFRDREVFETLSKEIIPAIIAQKDRAEPIRIWVCSCSTGEEAYTIAILVDHLLKKNQINRPFKIFGSDVDKLAIRTANKGIYPYNISADVPATFLAEYFLKEGDHFRVKKEIKDKVLFAVHNVLTDPPFIHVDMITCRNLLIYLKSKTQRNVLSTFHFALNTKGYLLLGSSETMGEVKGAFNRINSKHKIFSKKQGQFLPVRSPSKHMLHQGTEHFLSNKFNMQNSNPFLEQFDEGAYDPFTHYLVERFAPIALFLTGNLDILYLNGDLDSIIHLPKAIPKWNLHNMMDKKETLLFQNAVRKALNNEKAIVIKNIQFKKDEKNQIEIDARFEAVQLEGIEQKVVLLEIIRHNLSHKHSSQDAEQEEVDTKGLYDEQVKLLERELKASRKRAQKLVSELEATNEELQASNRELMAANEELQSTNEELQSVNEELYTVNSELQNKNEELTTANDDIDNLLRSTDIGTIFLDNNLRIRKFTPPIRRQFDLLDSDIGRPLFNFSSDFENVDIEKLSRKVFDNLERHEQEVVDKQGVRFFMRILPYRTQDDTIKGLVLTFVDISKLISSQVKINNLTEEYNAVFDYSDDVIINLSPEGVVQHINHSLNGEREEKLMGKFLKDLLQEGQEGLLMMAFKKARDTHKPQQLTLKFAAQNEKVSQFNIILIPTISEGAEGNIIHSFIAILKR